MGIKFHPGLKAAGIDPSTVEKLIEAQKMPVEAAKQRRDHVKKEKDEVDKLVGLLSKLDGAVNSLKTKYDFYKLKLDSSNPDIIDGTVAAGAMIGTYELEVRDLARSEKELAYGFPDKDETPIGFGFMMIKKEETGEEIELTVEPNTTLSQLATQINDLEAGIKAMVINTKYKPDPYRLLVVSEKSGSEQRIFIDEDTTFMEFKEQVIGRNLDVLFEDVPITDDDNILDDLITDVTLYARRSEPGTRVQVSIIYDIEKTFESIKAFVDSYNEVASFVQSQFKENPETGGFGLLSSDSTIKTVMRHLQSAVSGFPKTGTKFNSVAQIGITTDPKTGKLLLDEAKVKSTLSEQYDEVASLFIKTQNSSGIADSVSEKIKAFRDPGFGAVKNRIKGLDRVIENHNQEIERREKQMSSKEEQIKRQFAHLESTLMNLQGQGDFLKARFAADKEK